MRAPLWVPLAIVYLILGFLGENNTAQLATQMLRGLLPIAVILFALRPEEGDYPEPVIPMPVIWTLLAFQVLNLAEMVLDVLGVQLMPGRYITIEAMSVLCIVWAIAYCIRKLGGGAPTPAALDEMRLTEIRERYGLTERETQILELLYEGCSNQEIAERAFISEGTVKTHVHNIFQKTDAANRVQLLRIVSGMEE